MEVATGISFREARKRIGESFRGVVASADRLEAGRRTIDWEKQVQSVIPSVSVAVLFIIAIIIGGSTNHTEYIIVVLALASVTSLNAVLVALYKKSESLEVFSSLKGILKAYECAYETAMQHSPSSCASATSNSPGFAGKALDKTYLSSGHSQVSIVHVYRDHQWLRLPVLLLAEGDIIALMGGDITPGRCYEIERVGTLNTTVAEESTQDVHGALDGFDNADMGEGAPSKGGSTCWKLGKLMEAGEKVHIRNRQQFSQQKPSNHDHRGTGGPAAHIDESPVPAPPIVPQGVVAGVEQLHFGERHRSLGPESVEILSLSGDVRCFRMAETPITTFLRHTVLGQAPTVHGQLSAPMPHNDGYSYVSPATAAPVDEQDGHATLLAPEDGESVLCHAGAKNSLVRTLFQEIVVKEGKRTFALVILLTIVATVLRAGLLPVERAGDVPNSTWSLSILVPVATACLFFLPLAIPVTLVLMEALATADVLASAEVTLRPTVKAVPPTLPSMFTWSRLWPFAQGAQQLSNASGAASARMGSRSGSKGVSGTAATDEGADETAAFLRSGSTARSNTDRSRARSKEQEQQATEGSGDGVGAGEDGEEEMEDEFQDEDIDERAEDIAEEVSTQVKWSRYLAYAWRVLQHRLFLGFRVDGGAALRDEPDFLPIPLARNRLLEVLGAVTMVCFVDDDVICEGFSVTEEIFLLMDDPLHNSADQQQKQSSAAGQRMDRTDSVDEAAAGTYNAGTFKPPQGTAKGMVLDLHANPEATGSRFENPQWWRYLPSLKPLGLNAMLTYSYGTHTSNGPLHEETPGSKSRYRGQDLGTPTGDGLDDVHPRKRSHSSLPYPQSVNSPVVSNTAANSNADFNNYPLHLTQQQSERSLVRHIRHLLPLESLRELAEEIGFEQTDLSPFARVLEVNVLAPGLENAHLLEDTHQWGQEESRRRGSLLPQLRGGVYKDFRDGSLQMMCLGDPSLVLNYCREYWDGSTKSITPLSSADRAEVLSVFERWRLEDFEVVAFCYSPLPTGGLQPLLSKEDAQAQQATTPGLSTRHASASISVAGGQGAHPAPLVGRMTSGSTAAAANSRSSFSLFPPTAHQASFSAPFVPAKHNTLFFVDPITTQDLHRIAAGITSKTRGAALKRQSSINNSAMTADARSPDHAVAKKDTSRASSPADATAQDSGAGNDFAVDEDAASSDKKGQAVTSAGVNAGTEPAEDSAPKGALQNASATSRPDSVGKKDNQQREGVGQREPGSPKHAASAEKAPADVKTSPPEGGRKSSRSDASYMPPMPLCLMKGGALVKSVSLDRVQEYQRYDSQHQHAGMGGDTHGTSDHAYGKRRDGEEPLSSASSDVDALLLPLPRPLRTSMSARELGVKEPADSRRYQAAAGKGQPHTPVLLFPDDDEASNVSVGSTLSPYPYLEAGALKTGKRDPATGASAGVRFARHSSDIGFASAKFSDRSDSPNQLGLSVDVESIADQKETSRGAPSGALSDTLSNTVSPESPPPVRGLANSRSLGGGTLTPPLVPRIHTHHHHHPSGKGTSTVNALVSPQLRHHASEYVHPSQTRLAMQQQIQTSRQRQQQQQQRSHQQHRQLRRASTRQLWTLMRQQVFLGMAASSVPVRKDVPNIKEDLDSAGVRFVYFSAQNMKRSKPVAEKIGIPFDWNCAISLRELEGTGAQDPHRHISNYADWDVLAHMPHGIEAIKSHIQAVDNVPLLVSLFTDATPLTVRQMVEVFRDNGEVVLSIGGGYRSHNHAIYHSSDLSCSVSVLPGLENTTSLLPTSEEELVVQFPEHSDSSLSRADILLSFRLIGLTSINLLQTPYRADLSVVAAAEADRCNGTSSCACKGCKGQDGATEEAEDTPFRIDMPTSDGADALSRGNSCSAQQPTAENVRLSVLLETIRKGRIILRNLLQVLAFFCVASLSLGLWPLVSLVVPISIPPSPPPGIALLFQCVYVPALCVTLLQCGEPEGVMKNTPRKNQLQRRPKDLQRFCSYLLLRCAFVLLSIALVGWAGAASTMKTENVSFRASLGKFYYLDSTAGSDTQALRLVQDLMCSQALLSLVSQSSTLLVRGQTALSHFPWPWRLPEGLYYVVALLLMAVQAGIMVLREEVQGGRGTSADLAAPHTYAHLDWPVWLLMVGLPLVGVALGVLINRDDDHHYRRYLQFLRLEFETRLGMHSPR